MGPLQDRVTLCITTHCCIFCCEQAGSHPSVYGAYLHPAQRHALTWLALDVQVVEAVGATSSLNHVVDVFRGATNAAMRNKGHDRLPEHGLGKGMK